MRKPAGSPSRLVLFVRGNTARSADAIRTVTRAFRGHPAGMQALRIVDVLQEPSLLQEYKVVATPTLLSLGAAKERRWVGTVSEEQLRECLEGVEHEQ